jgi:hypothetical protein
VDTGSREENASKQTDWSLGSWSDNGAGTLMFLPG